MVVYRAQRLSLCAMLFRLSRHSVWLGGVVLFRHACAVPWSESCSRLWQWFLHLVLSSSLSTGSWCTKKRKHRCSKSQLAANSTTTGGKLSFFLLRLLCVFYNICCKTASGLMAHHKFSRNPAGLCLAPWPCVSGAGTCAGRELQHDHAGPIPRRNIPPDPAPAG